jgi:hypothetical protein
MENGQQRDWRKNASNELIVNSILAAVSAIVVQTIVTSQQPRYSSGWLGAALLSLLLFLISTEQLGESIREIDFTRYVRSSISYNAGTFFLFLALFGVFKRYAHLHGLWLVIVFAVMVLIWVWFWGLDMTFLIRKDGHYHNWTRIMHGDSIEEEILDHRDMLMIKIRRWRYWS